ncbi:imidazolonepropionase [Oscillospiraceae bacterium OttesenSCG-928-F05]|nr:imidazolonepropionase [Oscillospiraceae bacterium OttesenSCG-928-F05]
MDLLLTNIGLLATPRGAAAQKGAEQGRVTLLQNAAVGVENGEITYAGPSRPDLAASETIDCGGRLVTPGLVDAHTHLVFGGWRQREMGLKLAGVSYLDILKSGGGILDTVGHTRAASEEALIGKGRALLMEMLLHGTTTVEIKSGYGLDLETELKQLRVVRALHGASPTELVPTFMGAHAVPKEYSADRGAYIDLICDVMLPAVAEAGLAEFCDVFCESAVFTPEESRRILTEALRHGLKPKAHADEIDPIGGAELAASVGAISAEHLIEASDAGIRAMAERGVIAVLLPATSFYLDKPYARARFMVEAGVPVAVATDFNPGSSPSPNLQFAMNLACLKYKLTPAEALTAVTLNAAAAVGRAETVGSVEVGKKADLVLWDAPDLEYLFYRYGSNLANTVVKGGAVYKNPNPSKYSD